jgi:hypothetical protein
MERRHDGDARRFEPDLHVACRLGFRLPHASQDRTCGVHDNPRRTGLQLRNGAFADRSHHVKPIRRILPRRRLRRLAERKDGDRFAALLDRDIQTRELALRRLHHQVELARLSDVFVRLTELDGGPGLPSGPEPRHAAANDDQNEKERKELRKATHLLMMNDVGGADKVRVACVLRFSGYRRCQRLRRGTL